MSVVLTSWISRVTLCSGVCLDPFSPSGSCSPDKATRKGQKKEVPLEEAPAEPPPATDAGPDAGKAQDEQSSDDDSSSDEER